MENVPPCKYCLGQKFLSQLGKRSPGCKVFREVIWYTCPMCRGSGKSSGFAWDISSKRPIYS